MCAWRKRRPFGGNPRNVFSSSLNNQQLDFVFFSSILPQTINEGGGVLFWDLSRGGKLEAINRDFALDCTWTWVKLVAMVTPRRLRVDSPYEADNATSIYRQLYVPQAWPPLKVIRDRELNCIDAILLHAADSNFVRESPKGGKSLEINFRPPAFFWGGRRGRQSGN